MTVKMNKELKDKWVAALRGNDYVQGQGALRTGDNRYCCLGVLCELAGYEAFQNEFDSYVMAGSDSIPVTRYLNDMGLTAEQGNLLANKNDGGATFVEIADYIEKEIMCDG